MNFKRIATLTALLLFCFVAHAKAANSNCPFDLAHLAENNRDSFDQKYQRLLAKQKSYWVKVKKPFTILIGDESFIAGWSIGQSLSTVFLDRTGKVVIKMYNDKPKYSTYEYFATTFLRQQGESVPRFIGTGHAEFVNRFFAGRRKMLPGNYSGVVKEYIEGLSYDFLYDHNLISVQMENDLNSEKARLKKYFGYGRESFSTWLIRNYKSEEEKPLSSSNLALFGDIEKNENYLLLPNGRWQLIDP